MPDKYQLIKVKNDTLYILDKGLTRDDVDDYSLIHCEDDCDRMLPDRTYAASDSAMSKIFGR